MNTEKIKLGIILLAILMIGQAGTLSAQRVKGNKKVVKEERTVETFTGIDVGGAFEVFITQADKRSLIIETDENLLDNISTKVRGNVLHISSNSIKNATRLNVYITNPEYQYLNISGAAELQSENTISETELKLVGSGASQTRLTLEADKVDAKASGAAWVKLSGQAYELIADGSGAAVINARELITTNVTADAGGASHIKVFASGKVNASTSGAGDVDVDGEPEVFRANDKYWRYDDETKWNVRTWESGDTTTVKVGGVTMQVVDGDSTKVSLGNHNLIVDDDGNVKWERNRKQKFNGHWAGFELGINGYVDADQNIDVPAEYDFLTLKYEKSIDVNLNIFEQNINLVNNKLGLVTGIGLRWNNYRFDNNVVLVPDSSKIYGYKDYSKPWEKSKLVVNYLNVPLLLEYQTNRFSRSNSFHIAAGMVLGWRYASHTKMLYKDNGRHKPKDRDSFHLSPFRYDATVRIGWGIINLYGTYAMNTLFKDGRGPELYPFAVGITLVGW
ncbi:MAG: GIN domain-containing protein [Bacteroidota bacterium]